MKRYCAITAIIENGNFVGSYTVEFYDGLQLRFVHECPSAQLSIMCLAWCVCGAVPQEARHIEGPK